MTASFLAARLLLQRYQAGLPASAKAAARPPKLREGGEAGTTDARGSTESLFSFNRARKS